ncbi:hypothetical protein CYMTET_44984 [Cymbomonas tetramitiformis]|uniref:Uncharacterized protein n=1 Tax=Cymbomonas tetramitiformis TaxID=36881 RepID=A0AAE0C166_9CHLO|nr:hypothetical protein CYMTET_44984 [Cymbomonas tetramitiformis]
MSRRGWRERPRRCGDFSWHHEVVAHEAAEVRAFGEARQCYVDAVLRPELGSLEDATEFFRGLPGMAGVWAAAAQSHGLELSAGTWDTGAGVTEGWLRANGLALSGQLNRFDGNGPEEPNEFQDPVHMDVHGALVDTLVGVLSMRTLTTLDLSDCQLCSLHFDGRGWYSCGPLKAVIRALQEHPSIPALSLADNSLGGHNDATAIEVLDGIRHVARMLATNKTLKALDLSRTVLDPRGR